VNTKLIIVATCIVCIFLYTFIDKNDIGSDLVEHTSRMLSLEFDMTTHQYLRTTDGVIPEVSCPLGHYRPSGSTLLYRVSGQRQDGCRPCPKGRYGGTVGLKTASCSGACPIGTYGDEVGLEDISDCQACPPGTYGIYSGMTTSKCSGECPKGYYSDTYGASTCIKCPLHYHGWQCSKDINA